MLVFLLGRLMVDCDGQLTFIQVETKAYQACFLDIPPSMFHSVQNPVVLQPYLGFLFLENLVISRFLLLQHVLFLQNWVKIAGFCT